MPELGDYFQEANRRKKLVFLGNQIFSPAVPRSAGRVYPTPVFIGGRVIPHLLLLTPDAGGPLPHLKKVAECNYAESATGAISIRQTSVVSFSLSKAFLLPNCSYRIIA